MSANDIIKLPGLILPNKGLFRFSPGCCCGGEGEDPPTQGCGNTPDWIDESNIPASVTITLNCDSYDQWDWRRCFAGKSITLQYIGCSRSIFGTYYYRWETLVGTCPDGEYLRALFTATFSSTTSYASSKLSRYNSGGGYEADICHSVTDTADRLPRMTGRTVAEVVQLGAAIGGGGEDGGMWCNGHGDASIGFEFCKSKDNNNYSHYGQNFPGSAFCCASQGATSLIATLDFTSDYLISTSRPTCPHNTYQPEEERWYPVMESWFRFTEVGQVTVEFQWQAPNLSRYISPTIYVPCTYELAEGEVGCCGTNPYSCEQSALCPLIVVLRVPDVENGSSGFSIDPLFESGPTLPPLSQDMTGATITFPHCTVTITEAIYCEIP